MPPFRMLSIPHQIYCGYSTSYIRKRSASIRRASAQDAARHACEMRHDPAHPVRPLGKNPKKGLKRSKKWVKKAAKMRLETQTVGRESGAHPALNLIPKVHLGTRKRSLVATSLTWSDFLVKLVSLDMSDCKPGLS